MRRPSLLLHPATVFLPQWRGGQLTGSLVRRPVERVLRPRHALVIRDRGPALERVEQDVQSARDVHLARARVGVERVDDAEQRSEGAVRDAGLGGQLRDVGDGCAGRLCRSEQTSVSFTFNCFQAS